MAAAVGWLSTTRPSDVRQRIAKRDWPTLRKLEKQIRAEEARTRESWGDSRESRQARRKLALLALEFIRHFGLYRRFGVISPPHLNHQYMWYMTSRYLRTPEAVKVAKDWCHHQDETIRSVGAIAICSLAPSRELSLCLRLINDKEPYIATKAMQGVSAAFEDGYAPVRWKKAIVSHLVQIAKGKFRLPSGMMGELAATRVILDAGIEQGLAVLGSAEVLSTSNRAMKAVVTAMGYQSQCDDTQFMRLLAEYVDSSALWRIVDLWKAGKPITPRSTSVTWSDTQDDLVSSVIRLGASIEPKRALEELQYFKRRTSLPAEWITILEKGVLRDAKRAKKALRVP